MKIRFIVEMGLECREAIVEIDGEFTDENEAMNSDSVTDMLDEFAWDCITTRLEIVK
jgi:hypothetical protein